MRPRRAATNRPGSARRQEEKMQTPGDEGRAHVDACATCGGCEQCRWVVTQTKATHVIEVKVKVRHFCEHHGIDTPDQFIMAMGEGTWFTVPELRLPAAPSERGA
jgi:hypothetical protein